MNKRPKVWASFASQNEKRLPLRAPFDRGARRVMQDHAKRKQVKALMDFDLVPRGAQ